jgi:hypothetical protein
MREKLIPYQISEVLSNELVASPLGSTNGQVEFFPHCSPSATIGNILWVSNGNVREHHSPPDALRYLWEEYRTLMANPQMHWPIEDEVTWNLHFLAGFYVQMAGKDHLSPSNGEFVDQYNAGVNAAKKLGIANYGAAVHEAVSGLCDAPPPIDTKRDVPPERHIGQVTTIRNFGSKNSSTTVSVRYDDGKGFEARVPFVSTGDWTPAIGETVEIEKTGPDEFKWVGCLTGEEVLKMKKPAKITPEPLKVEYMVITKIRGITVSGVVPGREKKRKALQNKQPVRVGDVVEVSKSGEKPWIVAGIVSTWELLESFAKSKL